MIGTQDILKQAILDDPADTLARLAYADYLDESGTDPLHARLIRVQCAIHEAQRDCNCGRTDGGHRFAGGQHHNGPCAGEQLRWEIEAGVPDGRTERARTVEMRLLDGGHGFAQSAATAFELMNWDDRSQTKGEGWGISWTWDRGFIGAVTCPMQAWEDCGAAAVALLPLIYVRIMDRKPAVYHRGDGRFFRWTADDWEPGEPNAIPKMLLPAEDTISGRIVDFPTEQDARKWLSQRCLLWARGELL